MDRTKVISVQRKHAPIFNLLVHGPAIASRNLGSATVMTIASTNRTRKIAHQFHVQRTNLSAPTCGSAWKNRTNVTGSLTATTEAMNWVVHPWDRINAIRRNISVVNRPAFAYQLHGIVMAQTIATTIPMKRIVAKYHAPPIFISVTIQTVYSKRTFAMARMIAAITRTKARFMRAFHHHLNARQANGFALALQSVVSICHRCATAPSIVQMELTKERAVILPNANIRQVFVPMAVKKRQPVHCAYARLEKSSATMVILVKISMNAILLVCAHKFVQTQRVRTSALARMATSWSLINIIVKRSIIHPRF